MLVQLLSEKGTMLLLGAGAEYKEIRWNELDEKCFASSVFQDGRIYICGDKNLYAIGIDKGNLSMDMRILKTMAEFCVEICNG